MTIAAGRIYNRIIRWILALVVAMSTVLTTTAVLSSGTPLTIEAVAMAFDSASALSDFVAFNIRNVALGLMSGIFALLGVGLRSGSNGKSLSAPAIIVFGLSALLFLASGPRIYAIGATAPGWTGTVLTIARELRPTIGAVQNAPPPVLKPTSQGSEGDVVLIVDESVGGHYLDLNRRAGVRSGLLAAPSGVEVANFGIAAAATNFSVGSNYILRTGGTRTAYKKRNASVWAYAHQAGYQTLHLFAQSAPGLQNLMTANELSQIDDYINFDNVSLEDRDHAVARMLRKLLRDGKKQFIYVNKIGAHFPAWRYYPANQVVYQPTLFGGLNGHPLERRESILRWNEIQTVEGWRAYRNDYRNAIRWNVGGFFDILLSGGLPSGTTIIYTSDHGDSIRERNNFPRFLHGNVDNPAPEEGAVPMVVITPTEPHSDWKQAAAGRSGASHFRIFPTLLRIFGYDSSKVQQIFGPDLCSSQSDSMTFMSGFYENGSSQEKWWKIHDTDIIDPRK